MCVLVRRGFLGFCWLRLCAYVSSFIKIKFINHISPFQSIQFMYSSMVFSI